MRVLIVGIIVLAISVAGVSTYLIKRFSGEKNIQELEKEAKKSFKVLVAVKDIKIGAPITNEDLRWQAWAEEALNKDFITVDQETQEAEKKKEFVGAVARANFMKSEPIIPGKIFKREAAGFLSGMLGSGMRAVSVNVTPTSGASGFILPGDYVDVVLTHSKIREEVKKRTKDDLTSPLLILSTATEVILKNIRVIAIGSLVGAVEKSTTAVGKTATLELTPKQAEIVTTAVSMGNLSLFLRSLERSADEGPPTSYTTDVEVSPFLSNIIKILETRKPPPPPIAQAPELEVDNLPVAAPAAKEKPVKMFLGGAGSVNVVGQK